MKTMTYNRKENMVELVEIYTVLIWALCCRFIREKAYGKKQSLWQRIVATRSVAPT